MAFQAGYSVRSKLPSVTLLSAGDNQTIICGTPTIYLEASVDDIEKLPGHITEWEQLTGNPVTLTVSGPLTAEYPFTESSDKRFRFWVDKGRPWQQYKDVNIRHTPTSESTCFTTVLSYDYESSGTMTIGQITPPPAPSSVTWFKKSPLPTTLQGEQPGGIIVEVNWNNPAWAAEYVQQYSIYENGTLVGQIPSEPLVSSSGEGAPASRGFPNKYDGTEAKYVVATHFSVRSVPSTAYTSEYDFSDIIDIALVYNDAVTSTSSLLDNVYKSSYVRYLFSADKYNDVLSMLGAPGQYPGKDMQYKSSFVRYGFDSFMQEDGLSMLGAPGQYPGKDMQYTSSVTRYSNDNIGAGQ